MRLKLFLAAITICLCSCKSSDQDDPCKTETFLNKRVNNLNLNSEAEKGLNEITYILRPLNYISTERDYVSDIPKSHNIDFFFELKEGSRKLVFIDNAYRTPFTKDKMFSTIYEIDLDQLSSENIHLQTFTGKDIFFGNKPLGKVNLVSNYNNPDGVLRKVIKYEKGEADILSCSKTSSIELLLYLPKAKALKKEIERFLNNV